MKKHRLIGGHDLVPKISEILGLKHTRRIIIDIGLEEAVFVYTEMIGDERLYNVDFSGLRIEEIEGVNDD